MRQSSRTLVWAIWRNRAWFGGHFTHHMVWVMVLAHPCDGRSEGFSNWCHALMGHFTDEAVAEGPCKPHNYVPVLSEPDQP